MYRLFLKNPKPIHRNGVLNLSAQIWLWQVLNALNAELNFCYGRNVGNSFLNKFSCVSAYSNPKVVEILVEVRIYYRIKKQ